MREFSSKYKDVVDSTLVETIYVKSLWSKETNDVLVELERGDSIRYDGFLLNKDNSYTLLPNHKVKFATLKFNGDGGIYTNLTRDTREVEVYFVIERKGLYIFGCGGMNRLGVVDRNDKVWVVNCRFELFSKEGKRAIIRPEMILDRINPASRAEIEKDIRNREPGPFYFEVK